MIVFKDLRQVSRATLRRDVRDNSDRVGCSVALLDGLSRRIGKRSYRSGRAPSIIVILLCAQKLALKALLQSLLARFIWRRGIHTRLIDKCREQELQSDQERYVAQTTHLTEV